MTHFIFMKESTNNLLESKMDALVNPVNCFGVMGKGLAKSFKERFPKMFIDYKEKCKNKQIYIGKPYLFREEGKQIINFPTKYHWRNPSKIQYIKEGLENMIPCLPELGIHSLAIPALGCGYGRLDWERVKRLIMRSFENTNFTIELYYPI